ncbi:hypothetical protein KCU64_g67, partial [Aureobasidium melanogenum]
LRVCLRRRSWLDRFSARNKVFLASDLAFECKLDQVGQESQADGAKLSHEWEQLISYNLRDWEVDFLETSEDRLQRRCLWYPSLEKSLFNGCTGRESYKLAASCEMLEDLVVEQTCQVSCQRQGSYVGTGLEGSQELFISEEHC